MRFLPHGRAQRKAAVTFAVGAAIALSLVPLGAAVLPTLSTTHAFAEQAQAQALQFGEVKVSMSENGQELQQKPTVTMTNVRQFKVTIPVEGATEDQLNQLITDKKISLSLAREQVPFDTEFYPHQTKGGKLEDWKTIPTTFPGHKTPKPLFKDIAYKAETVDGKVNLVATFTNELLFGWDGIDGRDRDLVRSAMFDYTGAFNLTATVDGTTTKPVTVQFRPYDTYRTQPEVDAELPEIAKEANKNGLFAKVVSIGKSAQGRDMKAIFIAKSEADLNNYQALKKRAEANPKAVQTELAAGSLNYKLPIMYNNLHADENSAVDGIMEFLWMIAKNQELDYKTAVDYTDKGKAALAAEMNTERVVWSDLLKDESGEFRVKGIGFVRGSNPLAPAKSWWFHTSSPISTTEFNELYKVENRKVKPADLLDHVFFIAVPSENVDARTTNSRTNGWGFDLNRDNTYQILPETRAMTKLISDWNPISLHEFHGFIAGFQVEPCSPTHDPNNEYDLFVDTAFKQGEAMIGAAIANNNKVNSAVMPMRDYLKKQQDGSKFWEEPFDDMSTAYTPQYAMMHGVNAYTVEVPWGNENCVDVVRYACLGNADFVRTNKDKMFHNQLERFHRGIENIDADSIRKYYVSQDDKPGVEADVFRPRAAENDNFFPEYFVIPMDAENQTDRAAAAETINLLIRNDVKVDTLKSDTTIGEKTYKAGTVVVNMRQAKRNVANGVLYPNMVITNWSPWSLYSEPVTNFSVFRGFKMDTIRKVGAIAADAVTPITKAPEQKTETVNEGRYAILKTNTNQATLAANELLKAGKNVGLITEGTYAGSYLIAADDLAGVVDKFVLNVEKTDELPKAKLIKKDISIYVPTSTRGFVKDKQGNEVGLKDYKTREDYEYNWDVFVLSKQLGFTLTNDFTKASIAVGNGELSEAEAKAIVAGKPYVGYTVQAIASLTQIQDPKLAKLDAGPSQAAGHDALAHVEYPTDSLVTVSNKSFNATTLYGKGGFYFTSIPDAAQKLITVSADKPLLEGFMSEDAQAKFKGSIQAIDLKSDGMNMTLFANTLTNKAHQQSDYRYLTAAIYEKFLTDDFPAVADDNPTPDPGQTPDPGKTPGATTGTNKPSKKVKPGKTPRTADLTKEVSVVAVFGAATLVGAAVALKKFNQQ